APSLGDLDGDGDPDMLVGNRAGVIYYYRNNGSVGNPSFALVSNNYAGINVFFTSAPAIVDINSDSDKDLFVGNTKGGLYFYENWDVFGIKQIGTEIPNDFKLYQNYPNPFNPETKIKFDIPAGTRQGTFVQLKIYDITGKEITALVNGNLSPGTYEATWDAGNYTSGIYFYKLIVRQAGSSTGDYDQVKKMIVLK
ncbi:MAG TPA: FG-GAP-like repeat-containing protein, partial [Ignavibacteria bacterium]